MQRDIENKWNECELVSSSNDESHFKQNLFQPYLVLSILVRYFGQRHLVILSMNAVRAGKLKTTLLRKCSSTGPLSIAVETNG